MANITKRYFVIMGHVLFLVILATKKGNLTSYSM